MSEASTAQDDPSNPLGVFKNAPEILCVLDADLRIEAVNAPWMELCGFTMEELRAQAIPELVHPDDREATVAAFRAALRGERVPRFEHRFQCKGGGYLRLLWSAWTHPETQRIYAIVRNVTVERRDSAIFKSLADRAPFFLGFAAMDGQVLYINQAGLNLLGYPDRDPRTLRTWDKLHRDDAERQRAPVLPILLSQGIWEGETHLVHPSGERIPVYQLLLLIRDDAGEPDVIATIMYDRREQRRQETELRRLKALVDATPDFVGIASLDGVVQYINPGGLKLVGQAGKDPRTMSLTDTVSPEMQQRVDQEMLPAIEREGSWSGEAALMHVSGEEIPVTCVTVALRDQADRMYAFASWARDLRPQKQLEHALRDAIRSMSTPIIQVWEGVLALPVIGVVDGARATHMTESLLDAIARQDCRVAVLDVTGVETIDTSTLGHLFRMVRAASLLGSRCVLSGISACAAQAITHLDVDLAGIETFRSLREALSFAIRQSRAGA
jgi:PAS domain S-box-containing protein